MKFIALLLSLSIIFMPLAHACKDIIVTNSMTAGNYNLFMKVRDPSRPGPQVLFIANKGYEYSYHHPWKNEPWIFSLRHKIIGVATQGDTPPNMIKAGMMMSDAGIAYGDADSPTLYINPTRRAWDDFDWLLYAAENASNEDEALQRLQNVEKMHATGVGENLFVVGPRKAYVAEGDAFHFVAKEVSGIEVQSNYPKMLWKSRLSYRAIASSFDRVYEGYVKKWQVVQLGGLEGIRIAKIGSHWIEVRSVPLGKKVKIEEGEGAKVGNFWVKLEEIDGRKAKIKVCYEYCEWENEIKERLNERVGVEDLMNISRLTSSDLNGLRGMAEGSEKATMIFKIPIENYEELTMGWFAPDGIVAIFVPVHICDYDIIDAYKNGESAQISLNLLHKFGSLDLHKVERAFINENDEVEKIAVNGKAAEILTISDENMQSIAILIEKHILNMEDDEIKKFISLWDGSYYNTISKMEKNIDKFSPSDKKAILNIALKMCNARVKIENLVKGKDYSIQYEKAKNFMEEGKYRDSLKIIKSVFSETDENLFGIKHEEKGKSYGTIIAIMIIAVLFMAMIYIKRRR